MPKDSRKSALAPPPNKPKVAFVPKTISKPVCSEREEKRRKLLCLAIDQRRCEKRNAKLARLAGESSESRPPPPSSLQRPAQFQQESQESRSRSKRGRNPATKQEASPTTAGLDLGNPDNRENFDLNTINDDESGFGFDPNLPLSSFDAETKTGDSKTGANVQNSHEQARQMQLMLLEQQNKRRLMLARQEQEAITAKQLTGEYQQEQMLRQRLMLEQQRQQRQFQQQGIKAAQAPVPTYSDIPTAAKKAAGSQAKDGRKTTISENSARRYNRLYQQRLLHLRHEMSQRYMPQYGPPTQYPPQIARQYSSGMEKSAKEWVEDLMRREQETTAQHQRARGQRVI
ncbi:uncharacterized protein N7459_003444 [Penicillium hispanicum]|uniref:uncharacterized protein n=1 Tax=Penicillium hispanicum TaxID=1080232 RepID=UPI00253FDFF3|nr:uncharacterized protein N7459_003444 [Penicillium hispanicum]KAJ5587679.1 hypothetical protein N7459_003444 [Penicillium hispanicum]